MIKRKAAYALVGGILVTGLVFNAPTMATYVQNLGTATQTINAATWSVDFGHNLGTHTIFPDDIIGDDTITLTNGNSYPVKYTIEVTNEGDVAFNNALSLNVTDGTNSYVDESGKGEVTLGAGKTIELNSIVTWNATGDDTKHAGKQVKYNYTIVAEKVKEEVEAPETPVVTDVKAYSYAGYSDIYFKLNKELDLSAGLLSKDNVKIEFLKDENGVRRKIKTKDSSYAGYLNDENGNKYPRLYKPAEETKGEVTIKYFNKLSPGMYTTALSCDENDTPTHIKLTVIDDGDVIFADTFECNK